MPNWFTTDITQGMRTLEDRTAGLESLQKSIRALQTEEDISILDVGCAEGLIGDWITMGKPSRLLGIEGDADKVASANQIYSKQVAASKYKFLHANAEDLPTVLSKKDQFDVVLLLAILQKLNDPIRCLERAKASATKFIAIRAPEYFWVEHRREIYRILSDWSKLYEIAPSEDGEDHRGRLVVWQHPDLGKRINVIRSNLRATAKKDQLAKCDYAIVSFPKSGRTWIRYFLGKYLELEHNMPMDLEFMPQPYWSEERNELDFPLIHFTHDWFDTRHNTEEYPKVLYKDVLAKKSMILLIRNPLDTIVSYYYHKVKREHAENFLNMGIREFMLDRRYGLGRYCRWMDQILDYVTDKHDSMVMTYEDMSNDMIHEMNRMFDFMKIRERRDQIPNAVYKSDFIQMQKAELTANQDPSGNGIGRLGMRNWDGDVDKLKVRKGKIGSWQDELELDDAFMELMIANDSNIKVYLTRLKRRYPQCMTTLERFVR